MQTFGLPKCGFVRLFYTQINILLCTISYLNYCLLNKLVCKILSKEKMYVVIVYLYFEMRIIEESS